MKIPTVAAAIVNLKSRALSAHFFSFTPMRLIPRKRKGEDCLWLLLQVQRFLSISTMTTMPAMSMMIKAIPKPATYASVNGAGVGVGGGVASGGMSTAKAVSAYDCQ